MSKQIDSSDGELRLRPDTTIRFEKKKQLYRKRSHRPLLWSLSGVAAMLLFLLGIRLFFGERETMPENRSLLFSGTERIQPVRPAQAIESGLPLTERLPDVLSYRKVPVRPVEAPPEASVSLYAALPEAERDLLTLAAEPLYREQELVLNESAGNWRSSDESVYSRNIFSSIAAAGRQLTEQLEAEE
ncbi:MAG: hypothetical protein LBR65_06935 [Culturomica sp.]|jgi:hypothetical protein|nr:hypothetical protein [Culturomica sp.]